MAKALERKNGFFGNLFMKIMEIRRKWRWKVTGCMWGRKWRKKMENWRNRGLINKQASEDHLVTFCQFSFGDLSPFSLSHSWTLRVFLEHFNIGSRKAKKVRGSKDQARKSRFKQLQWDYMKVSICMCDFLARFSMHGYACAFLVLFLSWAWVFPGMTVFFNLSLPFPDSHGVMGFSCFGWSRLSDGFESKWGGSLKEKTHGLVIPKPDCGFR